MSSQLTFFCQQWEERSLGFPLLITKLLHKKLGAKAPLIRLPIKPSPELSCHLVYDSMQDQKVTLTLPFEPERNTRRKAVIKGSSSAGPTHEPDASGSDAPPAWAVEMQRRMMESQRHMEDRMMAMGGEITRRMGDLHHDVAALSTAGQYQGQFRGVAPYTELELQMMAMNLGANQGEHADDGAGGEDAMT